MTLYDKQTGSATRVVTVRYLSLYLLLNLTVGILQCFPNRLVSFMALLREALLDLQVQSILHKVCSIPTLFTVTITDAKHVHRLTLLDIGRQDKSILIDFVRIADLVAHTCCESKLLHHVLLFDVREMWSPWRSRSHLGSFESQVRLRLRLIYVYSFKMTGPVDQGVSCRPLR